MSDYFERAVEQTSFYDSPITNDFLIAEFAEPSVTAPIDLQVERSDLTIGETFCVRLDLEDLPCFSQVDQHYEAWGVEFKNAMAIKPSNPAYPPHSGSKVMMGSPESGWVEATFASPVRYVSSFITSSRRTVMMAFDRQNQLVAQTESPTGNLKQNGNQAANLKLSVQAANIHRITFHSMNGQITLDDFCFCG